MADINDRVKKVLSIIEGKPYAPRGLKDPHRVLPLNAQQREDIETYFAEVYMEGYDKGRALGYREGLEQLARPEPQLEVSVIEGERREFGADVDGDHYVETV